MAKELPYFRFTSQEWQNGLISLESYHLKGLFIDICSYYWVQNCKVKETDLHKKFQNKIDVKCLVNLKVLKLTKKGEIKILFLDEQLKMLSNSRKLKQLAGAKGGKQKSSNAKAQLQQNSSYKDKDKDKEKEKDKVSKEVPTLDEFISHAVSRKPNICKDDVRLKYFAWIDNDWCITRDNHKDPIKNWKTTLTNTLRYLKEAYKQPIEPIKETMEERIIRLNKEAKAQG